MRVFDKKFIENPFKKAVLEGKVQLGIGLNSGEAVMAEIAAGSGYDWLWIDAEHGPSTLNDIIAQARAIAGYSGHTVVRPANPDRFFIKQLLDAGIQTIIAPMVETKEQAEEIAKSMYYPPKGHRGFGAPAARAGRWNRLPEYILHAEDELFLILQIESKKGIKNLRDIVTTDGVGAIFLGPADLAVDMGYRGDFSGKEMQETIKKLIEDIRALGKPVGTIAGTPEEAKRYIDWGANFVAVGSDVILYANALDTLLDNFKHLKK